MSLASSRNGYAMHTNQTVTAPHVATGSAHGQAHDPAAHAPAPSLWPILLAAALGILVTGLYQIATDISWGKLLTVVGFLGTVVTALGWASTIIVERRQMDPLQTGVDLRKGFLYFLISEGAIFGTFFAHVYYLRAFAPHWPPVGAPHLATTLPAIGTLLLVGSSFTFNWGHHSFLHGKKGAAKNWLLLTAAMGITFLGIQGFEWGTLQNFDKFTLKQGVFGSGYYIMTGFHGLHVMIGLLMIAVVYFRMERGEFNDKYHFSLTAAEYYWHFVDIVWVALFFTIYLF